MRITDTKKPEKQLDEEIVRLLAAGQALSALEIQQTLESKKRSFSLKGIYLAFEKLQAEGLLKKYKKKVSLDPLGVAEQFMFWQRAYNNQLSKIEYTMNLEDGEEEKLEFFTIQSYMPHVNEVYLSLIKNAKEKKLYEWVPFVWFHLASQDTEQKFLKLVEATNCQFLRIIGADGWLARLLARHWDARGSLWSFSTSPFHKDMEKFFGVVDDFIVETRITPELRAPLANLYKNITGPDDLDISAITQTVTLPSRIKLTIKRNAKEAAALKKKFHYYFALSV
ncbi:MAG: hypothetical protein GC136_02635 [Alphaproteobacteria bacterium]|nr:hypothetical protein [Alphaproteobacteria bacterium]